MAPFCDAFTLARIARHSSITITQRYCYPQADAVEAAFSKFANRGELVTDAGHHEKQLPEPADAGQRFIRLKLSGERGRNRTFNLLIKSQLLCQLSYAPSVDSPRLRTFRLRVWLKLPAKVRLVFRPVANSDSGEPEASDGSSVTRRLGYTRRPGRPHLAESQNTSCEENSPSQPSARR
jgi:hypothetical protein